MDIEIEYKRGILFARLFGELNQRTSSKLELLDAMIQKAGIKYLLLNFEKVSIIRNEEFECLIEKYRSLLGGEGKLLICGYNRGSNLSMDSREQLGYIFKTNNEMNAFNMVNI